MIKVCHESNGGYAISCIESSGAHRIPFDEKYQMAYVNLKDNFGGVQIFYALSFTCTFHLEKSLPIS